MRLTRGDPVVADPFLPLAATREAASSKSMQASRSAIEAALLGLSLAAFRFGVTKYQSTGS